MKTLLACALFAFAACHHDAAPQKPGSTATATSDDSDDPGVDPTMPSWAPPSCKGYHAAVVKLSACPDIDQATKDKVSAKYDADNKSWHDMTNATEADLDQVKASCGDERAAVRAQMSGKCQNVQLTTQPTAQN
jgi:hypothetical protein